MTLITGQGDPLYVAVDAASQNIYWTNYLSNTVSRWVGGGVRSLSIEGGVTGLGADFIIVDDPVEIKDCGNIKRLERVNELFDNEIKTRLNNPKHGCIVVIAHRISEDDLPGHLLKKRDRKEPRKRAWKELRLETVCEPKFPVVSWAGMAVARCSCSHSTSSPLEPLRSSGTSVLGVTFASAWSGAASVFQPPALVSCQSQKDQPVAP